MVQGQGSCAGVSPVSHPPDPLTHLLTPCRQTLQPRHIIALQTHEPHEHTFCAVSHLPLPIIVIIIIHALDQVLRQCPMRLPNSFSNTASAPAGCLSRSCLIHLHCTPASCLRSLLQILWWPTSSLHFVSSILATQVAARLGGAEWHRICSAGRGVKTP